MWRLFPAPKCLSTVLSSALMLKVDFACNRIKMNIDYASEKITLA